MKSQFLLAAPASGSGKTTIARGLMALLTRQGYRVQPFKCGPDYIDTKFHAAVCGRPSVNLDSFMATPQHVRELFGRYGAGADVCVVEGMMGLFDGFDHERGSSYDIARTLDLPVVLVVDARSAAYSMAALLEGFLHFRSDVRFAGIIYNKVGSERHQQLLRQVCGDLQVPCLGCVPRSAALEQSARYLGLDFSDSQGTDALAGVLEQCLDVKVLLSLTESREHPASLPLCTEQSPLLYGAKSGFTRSKVPLLYGAKSGFTRNKVSLCTAQSPESFSFVYQETLDAYERHTTFNPEHDVPLLDDGTLLYLPGGYPEKHAEALAANEACRCAIRDFVERGGRIVAECGGMMYLCRAIVTDDGEFPMCGVLPYTITARRDDRRLSLGYRRFVLDGREYRGHEFHYTQFLGEQPQSVAKVYDATGQPVPTPVMRYKNVLASYTHLYFT